jgi:hypothetical protein
MKHSLLPLVFAILITGCSNPDQTKVKSSHSDSSVSLGTSNNSIIPHAGTNVYYYDPSVSTIEGIVCKKGVYRPVDEAGNSKGDTIIVLALKQPIDVVNPHGTDTANAEESFPDERNIDTVQLTLPSYHSLDKSLGHLVELKGTFYHSDNGNHFTNVLLFVKEARDGNNSSVMTFK